MRFDTPIFFQKITSGEYDEATGNYEEDIIEETMRYASVTSSGRETLNLIYGELKQNCYTIRLQNHYTAPFNRIRIAEKVYRVDFSRTLKNKQIFVVSEVQ